MKYHRLNTTMRERRDLPDGVLDDTAICRLTDRTCVWLGVGIEDEQVRTRARLARL